VATIKGMADGDRCPIDACSKGCSPAGKCAVADNKTTCGTPACDGEKLGVAICNGAGKCGAPVAQPCAGGFKCTNNACPTTCTMDAQCISTLGCVGGKCGKKPNGATCDAGGRCMSAICAGDHCCATACASPPGACASSGCSATGACVFPDASTECHAQCDGTMIRRSHCNGTGGCTLDAAATSCGDGKTCMDGACVTVPASPDAGL
jgi:hypothetical protein